MILSCTALERQRHVAGSTAQVEDAGIGPAKNGSDFSDCPITPEAVDIEGEEVIRQIVTGGDPSEHVANPS